MDAQLTKEIQIHNLLTALSMSEDTPENNEIRKKILDYVVTQEISSLQFDIALFPKSKKETKDYNFHLN